jgi:hypothetical protein
MGMIVWCHAMLLISYSQLSFLYAHEFFALKTFRCTYMQGCNEHCFPRCIYRKHTLWYSCWCNGRLIRAILHENDNFENWTETLSNLFCDSWWGQIRFAIANIISSIASTYAARMERFNSCSSFLHAFGLSRRFFMYDSSSTKQSTE